MEALKLIPQLFYDLISRIIPGFVALFLLPFAIGIRLGDLPALVFAGSPTLQNSVFVLGATGFVLAYLLGHIAALLADLYEDEIASRPMPQFVGALKHAVSPKSGYPPHIKDFLSDEIHCGNHPARDTDDKTVQKFLFIFYDWLRVHKPDVGERCAKIRAEYRMHAGIAVVMLAAIITHLMVSLSTRRQNVPLLLLSLLFSVLFTWAHGRTRRMFEWSVINQYYVAKTTAHRDNVGGK